MARTDLQAIRRRYDLPDAAPTDPLGLHVHRVDLGARVLTGWRAVRDRRRTLGAHAISSVLWQAGNALVKIECREEPSRQAAFGAVPEALLQFESPQIARTGDAVIGELAFASPGSVVFHRGNLLLAVTRFGGPFDAHLEVASFLDALLRARPTTTAARSGAAVAARRVAPRQRVALRDEVPTEREGMVRVFAPDLTVVNGATGVELIAPTGGAADFDVFVEGPAGVRHAQRRWEVQPDRPEPDR